MTFTSFVKLVELPTKVASVFPFLIGTTYAYYRYEAFNLTNFFIMLIAMLCLDLATTALNNYMDYKLAVKTHGFNYEQHNAIVKYEIKESTVKTLIVFFISNNYCFRTVFVLTNGHCCTTFGYYIVFLCCNLYMGAFSYIQNTIW